VYIALSLLSIGLLISWVYKSNFAVWYSAKGDELEFLLIKSVLIISKSDIIINSKKRLIGK
jgi:hypothetical protein